MTKKVVVPQATIAPQPTPPQNNAVAQNNIWQRRTPVMNRR